MEFYRSHVLVCTGTGCTSSDSRLLLSELTKELKANGLEKKYRLLKQVVLVFVTLVRLWLFILKGFSIVVLTRKI